MVPMAPSATMARRASCSRNSSARVVEAVGIGRYSDLLFSGAADPDIVILAHVGREGRRCSLYLDFEEGGMEKDGPQSRFSPNYAPSMAFRSEEHGEGRPAEQVFAQLRAKHGI